MQDCEVIGWIIRRSCCVQYHEALKVWVGAKEESQGRAAPGRKLRDPSTPPLIRRQLQSCNQQRSPSCFQTITQGRVHTRTGRSKAPWHATSWWASLFHPLCTCLLTPPCGELATIPVCSYRLTSAYQQPCSTAAACGDLSTLRWAHFRWFGVVLTTFSSLSFAPFFPMQCRGPAASTKPYKSGR